MTDTLFWRQHPVAVKYSHRKTIALHVDQGHIEIRAPKHVPQRELQQFLHSKSSWLQRTLTKQNQRAQDQVDLTLSNRIPFMGIQVPLIRHKGTQRAHWTLAQDGLIISANDFESREQTMSLLADFYLSQARFWLPKKTQEAVFKLEVAERLKDIRFRNTKTKWGHCTSEGRIQYNWLIMMAPEAIIDYLVSHEVSHLKYLNHSALFWQEVAKLDPNYQQHRRWLTDNGHRLKLE